MGSHAGRLALAGLLEGPFINIERALGPENKTWLKHLQLMSQ